MFLGLGTHELHFSLLREEVKFGKAAQKKISNAEEQKFHLLHISLFREYIDAEFQCLKVYLFLFIPFPPLSLSLLVSV